MATDKSVLQQDPHQLRAVGENNLERAIGRELKALRAQKQITLKTLSAQTGLSISMLSKIENGASSASLTTLQTLADTLSVPITSFFRSYEARRSAVYTKAGDGFETEGAGTRAGHQYTLLGHLGANASGVVVEPYLITLTSASDRFPTFQHDGVEMLYMLEGEVAYRHAETVYALKPGDTLFFEADAPHGPEAMPVLPARYLSVICYKQET
jgi:DNA-binding Xre family transcriptional regulator